MRDYFSIKLNADQSLVNGHRFVELVNEMESLLDNQQMRYFIDDTARPREILDIEEWVDRKIAQDNIIDINNGTEGNFITISGMSKTGAFPKIKFDIYFIYIKLPAQYRDVVFPLVKAAGEIFKAFWGMGIPSRSGFIINERSSTAPAAFRPEIPDMGLPRLYYNNIDSPFAPFTPGWINYWSGDTARLLGFPDERRDEELLKKSVMLESGAWIIRLTDEPLDLDIPGHLQSVKDFFIRFPQIGGRDTQARGDSEDIASH